MKKVVFCWELGGNYGHITSFLPFYRELIKAGVQVDFILRDLGYVHQLLGASGVRYFQAPLPKDELSGVTLTYTYTDLLAQVGYLDTSRLTAYVSAWRELLRLLDADMIIADHAPTALLAARTLELPAAMFGGGFFLPPRTNPMPVFHIWNGVPDVIAHKHNEPVLKSINNVLTYFNHQPLSAVCNLFDVAERFLCATSELDHYLKRADDEYWGPYFIDEIGIDPRWPDVKGDRIFAYLTPAIKSMEYLLSELSSSPGSKLIHIPRASKELIARYESQDLHIEPEPVKMKKILSKVSLIVHQSGAGTSSACLLAGVRQLLVPTQLEQRMLCKKLVEQGLAYGVDPDSSQPQYGSTIQRALSCQQLGVNLQKFQQKYFGFDQQEQYAIMAEVVCEVLSET